MSITSQKGILVNYCNMSNVYCSKLNKQFIRNFPILKESLIDNPKLGDINFIQIDDDVTIANCYVKLNPTANISRSALNECFYVLSELNQPIVYEPMDELQDIIDGQLGTHSNTHDDEGEEPCAYLGEGYAFNKDGISGWQFSN
jgi:hypothetical protein